MKRIFLASLLAMAMVTVGCSSDDSSSGSSTSTISVSGNLTTTSSIMPLSDIEHPDVQVQRIFSDVETCKVGSACYRPFAARTQCSDGNYYGVYCVSFNSNPTAQEGDVDCTNSGAFTVAGMPASTPFGCFVRRYSDATSTTGGSTVGTIEIPAATLDGSTEQISSSGNLGIAVTLGSDGSVTATVTSGTVDDGSSTTVSEDPTTFNGVYALACKNQGFGEVAAYYCKCFLGEDQYGTGNTYINQDDCLNDSGAGISDPVQFGVELNLYAATVGTGGIDVGNNNTIPEGATIYGITVWGTTGSPGSYLTTRGGGEGASTMGGKLAWADSQATTAISWDSGSVNLTTDSGGFTITAPTVPANTDPHSAWQTWATSLASSADGGGFVCSWHVGSTAQTSISCLNEVIQATRDASDSNGVTMPRVWIQPFCGDTDGGGAWGCLDDPQNDLASAQFYIEGLHFDYWSSAWTYMSDFSAQTPSTDSIGASPHNRYVFEPFEPFSGGGGGFRQSYEDERHRSCDSSGGGSSDNSICDQSGGDWYDLICYMKEDFALKFLPTSTSGTYDAIFDQAQSVGYARLVKYGSMGEQTVTPTGTTAFAMCEDAMGAGQVTFLATATKQ